jgi:rhamnose transport system substrate-binding protein
MLPKSKGNAYHISCKAGADKGRQGTRHPAPLRRPHRFSNAAKQNEIVENWITLGVDVIAVAAENREGISTALRKAQKQGIKVLTYDADAAPDARSFFVNQATSRGHRLRPDGRRRPPHEQRGRVRHHPRHPHRRQSARVAAQIEARLKEKYPKMKLVAVRPCDDLKDKAQSEATALLSAHPESAPDHVDLLARRPRRRRSRETGRQDRRVKVIGLGLPSENRRYVKAGVTDSVILWNTERPRLPHRSTPRVALAKDEAQKRRQDLQSRARSAPLTSPATTSSSASPSSLTRATSTSTISEHQQHRLGARRHHPAQHPRRDHRGRDGHRE